MFLMRHGQSYFDLHFGATRKDPGIGDPELTPLGLSQAIDAAAQLARVSFTRIIISPYARALQTADPILKGRPVIAEIMHETRERAIFTCDVGNSPKFLAKRFPQHDFDRLPARWWSSIPETVEQTVARADKFRTAIASSNDSATTLLVGHRAFIFALSGRSAENGEFFEYNPRNKPDRLSWT